MHIYTQKKKQKSCDINNRQTHATYLTPWCNNNELNYLYIEKQKQKKKKWNKNLCFIAYIMYYTVCYFNIFAFLLNKNWKINNGNGE